MRLAISQDADRHRVARNAEREVVRAIERIDDPDELPRARIEGQTFLGHQAVVGKTRTDPFHELRLDRDVDVRDPVAWPLPVDAHPWACGGCAPADLAGKGEGKAKSRIAHDDLASVLAHDAMEPQPGCQPRREQKQRVVEAVPLAVWRRCPVRLAGWVREPPTVSTAGV